MNTESVDVLVVGGGPSGLAAARALRGRGANVVVLEREAVAGGVPRHCFHTGFGIRDLTRVQSGPSYAKRIVELAVAAGVDVRPAWTVTGIEETKTVLTTHRGGRGRIEARALILATGCRERPRSARLVPGSRPAGIFTTGALQQLVHLTGRTAGRRAVVVGSEHVAFSAVQTLVGSGTQVAAVVTEAPALETYRALQWATAGRHRVPTLTGTRTVEIIGRGRVEAVIVADLRSGERRRLDCDTVVFTGDWVPDFELCRTAGLAMDPATHGPMVDTTGRTSAPGVFAAGNLVHPAEPADVSALGGRHLAGAVSDWLESPDHPAPVPLTVTRPLAWVVPQNIEPGVLPARRRLILRVCEVTSRGLLVVRQNGHELYRHRAGKLTPNRPLSLGAGWMDKVDPAGGVVTIEHSSQSSGAPT